jgi:hypothetical protein
MSGTARITIDAERVSVARSVAALARASARNGGPLVVVTSRMYGELERELRSPEAVARHMARVATNTGRPLAVNIADGEDRSQTLFVAPNGWSEERLAGWAAGHHQELKAMFGPATVRRGVDL